MGGSGEKPEGKRLATEKRHRADTEREAKDLPLHVGGKERVAGVCLEHGEIGATAHEHDEISEHAPDAIRYLKWACQNVPPSDRIVKRLAEAAPIDTPAAAATALTDMRERLAMLDAILTSAVHEAQDAREKRG